jgi:hypothetical protein
VFHWLQDPAIPCSSDPLPGATEGLAREWVHEATLKPGHSSKSTCLFNSMPPSLKKGSQRYAVHCWWAFCLFAF